MTTGRIPALARRHPVAVFFALAWAISWVWWAPMILAEHDLADVPSSRYLHLVGALGPALAALIVTALCSGRVGLLDLFRRMTRWQVGIQWYAVALAPAILFVVGAAVRRVVSGDWVEFSRFGASDEFPALPLLVYWLANLIAFGFGEETGWRGFALPHLQHGRTAWRATLLLWIGWAIWHVPSFFYAVGLSDLGLAGLPGWLFSLLLGAVILTWIYNSTGGSILLVALFHTVLDIAINTPDAGAIIVTVMGATLTIWGIGLLNRYGPEHLSHRPRQVAP